MLQPYLRWAGIDGVTNPFVPEVVVNHDLLPMEWPFTLAHEWGHLAGLAHEAEASYAGWLTCQAGTDQTRYSAALWAFGHVFAASPREQQILLSSRLTDGPRRDLHAIALRTSRRVRVVQRMSWATYDRYLEIEPRVRRDRELRRCDRPHSRDLPESRHGTADNSCPVADVVHHRELASPPHETEIEEPVASARTCAPACDSAHGTIAARKRGVRPHTGPGTSVAP